MSRLPKRSKTSLKARLQALYESVWLFPAILTVLLLFLTALQLSGSSIGAYNNIFYGDAKDPSLIANHPQLIRSDEWLVTSQLTIAQSAAGYPRVNQNIDSGRDMSVVGDSPYKDWSSVFKPQNLAFFVLPLGFAFAFKWWLLLYLVIISCYFVVLRFFPGKRLFAFLFSTSIGLSPFLFWWYTTGTLASIFYGFFIILVGIRIINGEPITVFGSRLAKYSQPIYALTLGYLLACFALILYPPFQVPIAISVAALLAGTYLQQFGLSKKLFSKPSLRRLGVFILAIVLALSVVFAFLHTRSNVVDAISQSAYPGKRSFHAGNYQVHELFTTYLQPQLQRISRGANYYTNQSEASQFILLLPFMLIPGFTALIAGYRAAKKIDWQLLAVQLCSVLFLAYLFVPGFQLIYKITLIDQVQQARIFIGLGFLGALQLLLIAKSLESLSISKRRLNVLAGLYAAACLFVMEWAGQVTRHNWPKFISSELLIGLLAVGFAIMIFCFISKRLLLAASLLLLFSVGSVYQIHPLYRGLGPIYQGNLTKAIDKVSSPNDTWVNLDNLVFENVAIMSNRDSISGTKPYPDVNFWRQIDGTGTNNSNVRVYNRYAHVLFSSSDTMKSKLLLVSPDTFAVKFGCYPFVEQHVQFAMSTHPLNYPCIAKVGEVKYPAVTFYLYKIQ